VLVSAAFDVDDGPRVTLGFDRPVDVSGFVPAQLVVRSGDDAYDGAGGAMSLSAGGRARVAGVPGRLAGRGGRR
jgi:hypothetical protein